MESTDVTSLRHGDRGQRISIGHPQGTDVDAKPIGRSRETDGQFAQRQLPARKNNLIMPAGFDSNALARRHMSDATMDLPPRATRLISPDPAPAHPLVTVVIPAFNSEETIEAALESALDQTYRPLEVLVVDDHSSDGTAKIVESYACRGVKLLHLPEQRGASGARNAGVEAATGELIAFLDSDDEWLPLKLEKQAGPILSDGDCVFVSCAAREFSPLGEDRGDLYHGRRPVEGVECWKSLLACNTVATPSVLVWRKHLLETDGFDEKLKVCEDQDMWIRLAARGSVRYVNDWLVRVNSRPNSLSGNLSVSALWVALDVVERHLTRQRQRLSRAEIRKIRAERLAWIGRAECNADYPRGIPVMLRSLLMGHRPLQTMLFLVSASPPACWLKRRIYPQSRLRMWRNPESGRTADKVRARSARVRHPMLPENDAALVRFPIAEKPRLVVIVDAEEEFDWGAPFSRDNRSVQTMAAQSRAHKIFRRFGVIPTYAIDYPVVTQEVGYRSVMELLQTGECEIGAQLHPWVTPPFEEALCERTSYPGNLPKSLEQRKLETLVSAIRDRFGVKPLLYRAGRYGTGKDTAAILDALEFDIDCSVVPGISQWSDEAPDYTGGDAHPYWLSTVRPILELPVTVSAVGPGRHLGEEFYRRIHSDMARFVRLPAIMARSGLLNRIRLSPEGSTIQESRQLTRSLLARGYRFFAISYHSPSLEPGHTPYVRNSSDLERFLSWIEQYLEFFFEELDGLPETASGAYAWARTHSVRPWRHPCDELQSKRLA
jgi:glycosyltransferase involved in cell wall biosynthesis